MGLQSVNITLKAKPIHRRSDEINYNERFYWIGPTDMKQEFQTALAKGLPYTILTIAEYLSQDSEGFCWGRSYRLAGYYASILLWVAFSTWILMNLLLCAVPRYGAYTMQITGVVMLFSNVMYALLLPRKPLMIPFEGGNLTFGFGWCFWLVLAAGSLSVVVGAVITIVDILFPNKFSTILEVDYDTPYRYFVGNDAHLIGVNGISTNGSVHSCQHHSAYATNSNLTESTCFGMPLSSQNSTRSRDSSGMNRTTKSDKSTSTTEKEKDDKQNGTMTTTTTTTIANIENDGGVINEAYQMDIEIEDENENNKSDHHNEMSIDDDDDDGDSDVSTTIIDGKRAISLSNFAKFAAQQQKEGKQQAHSRVLRNKNSLVGPKMINTTTSKLKNF